MVILVIAGLSALTMEGNNMTKSELKQIGQYWIATDTLAVLDALATWHDRMTERAIATVYGKDRIDDYVRDKYEKALARPLAWFASLDFANRRRFAQIIASWAADVDRNE